MSDVNVEVKDEVKDVAVEKAVDEDSAFAYLDRDHFTSEKFKVEIRNLPKYYGMPELKKLLNKKLNLSVNKIKRPHNGSKWIYVCFRSEEAREQGIKTLDGYKWKGMDLKVTEAKAVPDPLVMKRKGEENDYAGGKRARPELVGDVVERMKDAATPLWRETYEKQLEIKLEKARALLTKLAKELASENPGLAPWVKEQCSRYDGLPCELMPIKPSPLVDGYRNKCEFTIGRNTTSGEKTVGLRLASYAKGSLCVVSPEELPHVPQVMKKACAVADQFIRASSLDIYNQETHEGYWKSLTARYGFKTNQLMLMFVINRQILTDSELSAVEEELRGFFSSGAGAELAVHSLLLATTGKGRERPHARLVSGQAFIHEEVCERKFRISPHSFFQINTSAAEVLFNSIAELSHLSEQSSLIDICCGAGTIAICLSKSCGEVLGLEKWEEAVQDAKQNAEANGVENAQFFAGCAEDILSAVIHRASKPNVVAVVDPPRAGLERNAVAQLRRTKQLQQFVYASCQPQLALKNFVDFGRAPSKQYANEPFVPIRCIPVDLFPHTDGVELVIFFQRLPAVKPESELTAVEESLGEGATPVEAKAPAEEEPALKVKEGVNEVL